MNIMMRPVFSRSVLFRLKWIDTRPVRVYIIEQKRKIYEVNRMTEETGKLFDANIEGICFDEDDVRSDIDHFSTIINSNGIVLSILDDAGKFTGEMFLNPGETKEIDHVEKCDECKKRKILFGLINRFDEEGNITSEYFPGFIDETKTIIIIRETEDFQRIKRFENPGATEKIAVGTI